MREGFAGRKARETAGKGARAILGFVCAIAIPAIPAGIAALESVALNLIALG